MKLLISKNQRLIITTISALFILIGTLFAVQFAKGYRPTRQGNLSETGLLNASSNPEGSLIFIDGELSDKVTDDTINLNPGEYFIEIKREGFTTWQKKLTVEKELVTSTNAHLFRSVPSLTPQTFSGAKNLTPSPDGRKIAFTVASPSAQLKAGLYMMELSDRPGLFSRGSRLLAENPRGLDFTDAQILWSPDSGQLIASLETANYILNPNDTLKSTDLVDASLQIPLLLTSWEQEITEREKRLLLELPEAMIKVTSESAKNLYFSPDGEKLLYTATQDATIPDNLIPPLPASNNQPESRNLIAGNVYIYDINEDKNFLAIEGLSTPAELPSTDKIQLVTDFSSASIFNLQTATSSAQLKLRDATSLPQTITNFRAQYSSFPFQPYQWFPTSNHILINQNGSINVVEYDNTNLITLYQGPFFEDFIYPWPDGSRLLILTNLTNNPALPPNLYAINLK